MPQRRKRHGTSTIPPTVDADALDQVWAVDFQFDVTTDGRPIKIVSISDEHTRECLGAMVERSITGEHPIDELDRVAATRGAYPADLRCDNVAELACGSMADWADGQVGLHFIPPGEPCRNGYFESFNSRIRDECRHINSFWSPAQDRVVIHDWKQLQPSPPALIAGLLPTGPLCCRLYSPMNDSRSPWTSSRGPASWRTRRRRRRSPIRASTSIFIQRAQVPLSFPPPILASMPASSTPRQVWSRAGRVLRSR